MPVNYRAIKESHRIEIVARDLGLKLQPENGQYRAPCPRCNAGGDRALVITPANGTSCGLWYDFHAKQGGTVIDLVAHVKNISFQQAAVYLQGEPEVQTVQEAPQEHGMSPLAHLDSKHPAIQKLNMDAGLAEKLGIGWASKGLMRNHLAIPLRLPDGTLIGYIGVTEAKVPKDWRT